MGIVSTTGAAVASSVARRVITSVSNSIITTARRWSWANPSVLVSLALMAIAAYLIYRRGSHQRIGAILDSALVTADSVLDPDPAGVAPLRHPVRRMQHAVIDRITRGAVARRGKSLENGS